MMGSLPTTVFVLLLLAGKSAAFLSQTATNFSFRSLSQKRDEDLRAENLVVTKKESQEDWRDAKIILSRPACPSGKSTLIRLQLVDDTIQQNYTIPGQFVQFRYKDAEPIFLAIASAPHDDCFEFLIKMASRLTWLPEALVEGNTVQISRVMGNGFPLEKFLNSKIDSVILAAAGSGIAPIKACIESGKLPSDRIKLYYGEWNEEDLCFTELYENWKSEFGMEFIPVLSRSDDTRGYIQSVLRLEEKGLVSPETTGVILCGMDDMVESCTSVLIQLGVKKEHILLNL